MHIGKRIKLARVARGWTQEDLAQKIGKTRPLISHIEKTGEASGLTLRLIYEALEISSTGDEPNVLEKSGIFTKGQPGANEYYRQEIDRLKHEIDLLLQVHDAQIEVITRFKRE